MRFVYFWFFENSMKQDLHLAPQHSKCKIEDYEELENSSSDFMDYVLSKSHPSVAGIGVLPSGEAGIVLETLVNNLGKTKTQIDIVSIKAKESGAIA